MSDSLEKLEQFSLVGARFSRIVVNEAAMMTGSQTEMNVEILKREPVVTGHKYGHRAVIELSVRIRAAANNDENASPAFDDPIFDLECIAGFVGTTEELDGDLAAFDPLKDTYARSIFWILRERIDSIFSVTVLKATHNLPWDIPAATLGSKVTQQQTKGLAPPRSRRKAAAGNKKID